jgi:hypothetical protein
MPSDPAVDIVVVDVKTVASGYSANALIGSDVLNQGDEVVGTIEDLILDRQDRSRVVYIILEVGGFLGLGGFRVAVEYNALKFEDTDDGLAIRLPGATQENLKDLPEYKRGT